MLELVLALLLLLLLLLVTFLVCLDFFLYYMCLNQKFILHIN